MPLRLFHITGTGQTLCACDQVRVITARNPYPSAGSTRGDRADQGVEPVGPAAPGSGCNTSARSAATQYECITMSAVFKAVRDSDWSAGHIAGHGITLDDVREVILERP